MIRERYGKWHYRFNLDGREYAETTGLEATRQNRSAAERMEQEHKQALLEGRTPQTRIQIIQFSDALPQFLEWIPGEYRAHPNSWRRIKTSMTSCLAFFKDTPVSAMTLPKILEFKTHRQTKAKVEDVTVKHDLDALSVFFKFAKVKGWARENPIRELSEMKKMPSGEAERMYILNRQEEKLYFTHAAKHQDLYDLGRLMLLQGARPEEVMSLPKANVDLEGATVKIVRGKSKAARRTLDLTPESLSILARRMSSPGKWVFPAKRKAGCHISRLNNAHDRILAKTGLDFVIYDFRHTFATRMVEESGCSLPALAAILGHGSLRMVTKYVHPTREHQREAMQRYAQTMVEPRAEGRAN